MMRMFVYCIFIFSVFVQCTQKLEGYEYYTYFQGDIRFPSLNLKLQPEQTSLEFLEKNYITKNYGSVVQIPFSEAWSAQEQYIYLRALLHLSEWDKLYQILNKYSIFYTDLVVGPYLSEVALRVFIQKKDTALSKEAYQNFQIINKNAPVNKTKQNSLQDMYAAFLGRISFASTEGGYYFYRYDQDHANHLALYKAIRFKNPDAIQIANFSTFRKAVPRSKNWSEFLPITQSKNKVLYLELLKHLNRNQTLAAYYFNQGKYSSALQYASPNSFYHHASALITANKKYSHHSLSYAQKHLKKMFFYLASYYYEHKNFSALNRLFYQGYAHRSLRLLIVLGLNKREYTQVYKTLQYVLSQYDSQISVADKAMVYYWLGFLSPYFGKQTESIRYYRSAAIYYPNLYYGWEAFKALDNSLLSSVFDGWENIYKTKQKSIQQFIAGVNSIILREENLNLKRAFFFFKIREDEKAKKFLQFYMNSLKTMKEFSYYPLATAFYKSHRMDYFYFYMRAFLKRLQNVVGSYLFFEDLLPSLFPVKYQDFINDAAKRYGFSPSILESLILQESAYDHLALSWVGAQGLSQLMPTTGAPIIKKLYQAKVIKNEDIWDPRTNIFVGADYMNWLMNRVYKGYPPDDQLALAYASYNAGPKRIKKMYHRMENRVNLPHFVESIDFTESRDYVQRLTFAKDIYGFLYHSK